MRVNIYAEEMTDRIEIISKTIEGREFTGCRFYLELPVTVQDIDPEVDPKQVRGPFMHGPDDDDSAAVTFWGKSDLRPVLMHAIEALDSHYGGESVVQVAEVRAPVDCAAVVLEICQERTRQIDVEGFNAAHDDDHKAGELASAASCYVLTAVQPADGSFGWWPFSVAWWKPSRSIRRNLIKAAALIVAEIERIDRVDDKVAKFHNPEGVAAAIAHGADSFRPDPHAPKIEPTLPIPHRSR